MSNTNGYFEITMYGHNKFVKPFQHHFDALCMPKTSLFPVIVRHTLYVIFKKDYNSSICRDNSHCSANLESALKNMATRSNMR